MNFIDCIIDSILCHSLSCENMRFAPTDMCLKTHNNQNIESCVLLSVASFVHISTKSSKFSKNTAYCDLPTAHFTIYCKCKKQKKL